ncbi:MAG: hypothetical protein NTU89_02120 [Candidatus Dependentiae bacterium]|nr:hypothetical protein [Candidatus Dependentiae bacterium]
MVTTTNQQWMLLLAYTQSYQLVDDGDYYESTMDALTSLYPKLSIGGWVIIDDYNIPCCAKAVHDFRNKFNITDELCKTADNIGAFWKRTKE